MKIDPASKLDILQKFFQLQQKATGLLLESDSKKNRGELTAAMADYDELIITLRKQLELALHNNSLYPESPFEIPLIVGPLINAMLTLSDVYPIHTGKLEGVNNKIKVIKRKAYGFHDLRYFTLKIYQAFSN